MSDCRDDHASLTRSQSEPKYLTAGSSGLIYLLNEHRVLKKYFKDEEYAKERECRAFEILGSHPNIVHYFPSANASNAIILERGECLRMVLRRQPPPSLLEKLDYAKQAADGLHFIHSKGIVHADVGLHNMILIEKLDKRLLAFIDFAGCLIEGDADDRGACYEWCSYRPSRNEEGRLQVTRGTDIFAYGCMLYELMTGSQPHYDLIGDPETDDRATLAQRRWENSQFPEVTGLPLSNVILNCWRSKFQSMEEVVDSLAGYPLKL